MPVDLMLPTGITMAVVAWILIFRWYLHPRLSALSFADAMRPLVLVHTFRYVGLMFLIPGVTSAPLDPRFAEPAAYGDLIAAVLAFGALASLAAGRGTALIAVTIFNVWGLADLLNAVARGLVYTQDGTLGAAYWIPATIVPPLVVSHAYIFARLLRETRRPAMVAPDTARPAPLR